VHPHAPCALPLLLCHGPYRKAEKLELHHTPKQGSWLDIAEIELPILARQCEPAL